MDIIYIIKNLRDVKLALQNKQLLTKDIKFELSYHKKKIIDLSEEETDNLIE